MALWTEIDPAELTAFSRVAQENLDTGPFAQVLPNVFQDEVKFTWRVDEVLAEVAQYGDFDTESSIGGGAASSEQTIRLLPVSRKLRLSEYEQISDPVRALQLAEDKADAVVRFVLNRLNLARAEALVDGALDINENGIVQAVPFGRPANQTNQAPTELFSAAGADPIADLRRWFDRIADASGVPPNFMSASTRVYSAIAAALGGSGYITTGVGVISRTAVNEVFSAYELPPLTIDDTRVAGQRTVADDKLIMASTGGVSGGTVYAPTVESRDPRYNLAAGDQSGIVAAVYSEDDPPVKWVMGKAVALPVLANPKTTLSAVVL